VERCEEIPAAIEQALASRGPVLIDLVLTQESEDHRPGCPCGQ